MTSQRIADSSVLLPRIDASLFLEKRIENDVSGNPIYIGYTRTINADPDESIWYIQKISYTDGYPVRIQLPSTGAEFTYAWTDRVTYF